MISKYVDAISPLFAFIVLAKVYVYVPLKKNPMVFQIYWKHINMLIK